MAPVSSEDQHRELVQQAAQGATPALQALLQQHLPALLAYIRLNSDALTRQHESCADVAQSVCRDALADLAGFEYRGEGAFCNWLCKRALAKLANRRRHYLALKRDVGRERPLAAADSQAGIAALYASLASPSEAAIASETVARMERAFDRLTDDQRQVINLARVVGLGHDEVAAEMGRSEGAVRTLLHRALAKLGRLMDLDAQQAHG